MWITKTLLLISVSIALATDGPSEEEITPEAERQARYVKDEVPLLLIRPVTQSPQHHAPARKSSSLTSSIGSSLSSLLPKLGFNWDFLGGGKSNNPPDKVTYKILNFPNREPIKKPIPAVSSPLAVSALHTSFIADHDALNKPKTKYPAYNPRPAPLESFYTLPLRKEEPEPVILKPKNHHESVHLPPSEVIVGKPSYEGVNIPPHIEATLIESNRGVYQDLTGEISHSNRPQFEAYSDYPHEVPIAKFDLKKHRDEPYEFDYGGQEILLDEKPISLSPSLLPREHFKNTRERKGPSFTVISDDVINIVNPPSHKKNTQKPSAKITYGQHEDAISIVKSPSQKEREYLPESTRSKTDFRYTHAQFNPNKPQFLAPTLPTPEYLQQKLKPSGTRWKTSPQTFSAHLDNIYEVNEEVLGEKNYYYPKKQFFLPSGGTNKTPNHIGIGKYMEDARKIYYFMQLARALEEAERSPAITTQDIKIAQDLQDLQDLKDKAKAAPREEEVEIITHRYPLNDYQQASREVKSYNDHEEKYFQDLEVGKKVEEEEDEGVDEYFLPKREPIYQKLYADPIAEPTTSTHLIFQPSASIQFGEDEGRDNFQASDKGIKGEKKESHFWPPVTSSEDSGTSGFEKYIVHTTEKNYDYEPRKQYFLPSTMDVPKDLPQFSLEDPSQDFHSNHNYQNKGQSLPDNLPDSFPTAQSYFKDMNSYQALDYQDQDYYTVSTPSSLTKITLPSLNFKDSVMKKVTPRPAFYVKITTTGPPVIRKSSPTSISCERRCIQTTVTQEYLPVCGSDGKTYSNRGKLSCANNCGKEEISVMHLGSCTPTK
ncbi:hypothetical protein DMENIID0001_141180 [Sergentomyia squamirostris]